MSFTDYTEAALLNTLFGKTSSFGALAAAPTLYVALFTTATSDAGGGTEAAYTSYARVATTAASWAAATGTSPTSLSNAAALAFPEATGGSSTVTHFALFDAASAGNMIAHGALSASRAISSGITPEFAIGELTTTLD